MEIDVFQQFEEYGQAFGLPYHKYQAQETVAENEAERRRAKFWGHNRRSEKDGGR